MTLTELPYWLRRLLPMQETQETQVRSLAKEDSLETGMATHSSVLACRISQTEERSLVGYSS